MKRTEYYLRERQILFLVPSLVGVCIFFLIPFTDIIKRAFTYADSGVFAGIDNFKLVISSKSFVAAVGNNLAFILIAIPLLLVLSSAIAVYLYLFPKGEVWIKTGLLLPMTIPPTTTVLLWRFFFDQRGVLNGLLNEMGETTVDWMNGMSGVWIVIAIYVWRNIGFFLILWMAGLRSIPWETVEAAKMDGAGSYQIARYILFPQLKGVCGITFVLALYNSFKVFRETRLITGDYPSMGTYTVQYVLNNWFNGLEVNKVAAGSILYSLILILIVLLLMRLWNDGERNNAE